MLIEPRWYQEEAVNAVIKYLHEEKGNPLVALPTGTGKSLVIAGFIWLTMVMMGMFNMRVIMATHDKKLIAQNAKTLLRMWPEAPLGIVSAGLGRKDLHAQIIFGGIKSLVNKLKDYAGKTQWVDVLIVDEAHMINNKAEGQYAEFILELMAVNPNLRVIGLTATWFRLGQGTLTDGRIFDEIVYNLCDIPGFARLLGEGYLSPLITRPPNDPGFKIDLASVGIGSDGDFRPGALQDVSDRPDINYAALREIVAYGENRRCWMIFASGVEHCDHLQEMLAGTFGVPCVAVHSKMKKAQIDAHFAAFESGEVRCLINKDMATTGFDHPPIDLIGDLGATVSAAKHVQKNGRATRPYDGMLANQYIPGFEFTKENAMVLDFVRNIERCGPINDPVIPKPPSEKKGPGDAPIKICDNCGNYNHPSVRFCTVCGEEFDMTKKIENKASSAEIIRGEDGVPEYKWILVDRVIYNKHITKKVKLALDGGDIEAATYIIKVSYYTAHGTFFEWVTVETPQFPSKQQMFMKKLGRDWFRKRYPSEPPETNAEVLEHNSFLKQPKSIKVWTNKKPYPQIMDAEF